MRSYFILLHPYYLALRNHVRKSQDRSQTLKRDGLLLGVSFLLLLTIYAGVVMILNAVEDDLLFREVIPSKLLELLSYTFFILQCIGATIAFTGNVYHSESMNLHLSTPLSTPRFFFSKFLETLYETSFMFSIFTFPIAVAYIHILDLPLTFFLVGILAIIPFLVIANAVGFVLATATTYLTAIIWKRGLLLLVAAASVGGWLLYELLNLLNQVQLQRGGGNAIVHLIGLFDNPNPNWLPSNWLAGILTHFIYQRTYPISHAAILLSATALGTLAFAYLVFDYCLLRVRSRVYAHDGGNYTSTHEVDFTRKLTERFYYALPIDQALRAVMIKDMTSLFRDRSQSLKLVLYLGIAISYLILIKFMSSALILNVYGMSLWWAFLGGINALFGGFILTAVMTRLVYPSISMEGKAFWIMNSAPMPLAELLRAKLYCWLPLSFLVASALLLTGVLLIYPSAIALLTGVFIAAILSVGCTALAIGIGAVFAKFEWESANQISSGLGTLVLFFSSLVFVAIITGCATTMFLVVIPPWPWSVYGVKLACALSAAIIISILCTSLFSRIALAKGALALRKRRA